MYITSKGSNELHFNLQKIVSSLKKWQATPVQTADNFNSQLMLPNQSSKKWTSILLKEDENPKLITNTFNRILGAKELQSVLICC